jgi:hypothetical protein
MVSAVLLEKPKDPILFMIRWLQNYSGIQNIGENIEQTELENLRKEVKKYKKKYEQEDKEMEVSSEDEDDISPEEQKKIDEEMKKRQAKKKGNRTSVSAEVYGIHNVKKTICTKSNTKNRTTNRTYKSTLYAEFYF